MSDAKSSKKFYVSPKGTAAPYCWIQKPDTKFKAQGEYKVNLNVPYDEAEKLMGRIEKLHNDNYKAAKADPKFKGKRIIEAELPFYHDEDTGLVTFKFKMNASFIDKKTQEVKELFCRVVDSKGERMPKAPAISGGSELKVRFSFLPFAAVGGIGAGIKLQMDSIMLIKLVEFTGGIGGKDENWADETEEGGFTKEAADRFDDHEDEEEEEYSQPDSKEDF